MELRVALLEVAGAEPNSSLCVRLARKEPRGYRFKRCAPITCDGTGAARLDEEVEFSGSSRAGSLVVDVWSGVDRRTSDLLGKLVVGLNGVAESQLLSCSMLTGQLRLRLGLSRPSTDGGLAGADTSGSAHLTPAAADVAKPSTLPAAGVPDDEEKASFIFTGQRARPRKGIAAAWKVGETYLKPPGSCKSKWPGSEIGVQVECCERCHIYVLDVCAQVQVDDCKDCRIVIGPCAGSVFLRNCEGCTISVVSRQLRLREVERCELRVFVPEPEGFIVEASRGLRVGKWEVEYPELKQQLRLAGFAPGVVNFWNRVYDFSPGGTGEGEQTPHWELLSEAEHAGWVGLEVRPEGLCRGSVREVPGAMPVGLWAEEADGDANGETEKKLTEEAESYLDDYESDEEAAATGAQSTTPSFKMDDYDDVEELEEDLEFGDGFEYDEEELPLPGESPQPTPASNGSRSDEELICTAAAGAEEDAGWAAMHAFMQASAPVFVAMQSTEQQRVYEEFQQLLEPRLTEVVEALSLPIEEFVGALARVDAHKLQLPQKQKAIGLQICSLDSFSNFRSLMEAEAEAAQHPVRKAALRLQADATWQQEVRKYLREHGTKFAKAAEDLAEGRPMHKQLAWTALHQDYQMAVEEPLEDALDLPLEEMQELLKQLASGRAEPAAAATPLAAEAILPLRAVADYAAFEEMMLTLALAV